MKTLPVPPLEQTLPRYLETVAPLLDESQLAAARRAVAAFAEGDGPACQETLARFAVKEDAAGRSWLWNAWLQVYHSTRPPLPLVSNVGFEIRLDTPGTGTRRAAEVTHRLASAYLAHLRGEVDLEVSPRGEELCQLQWGHVEGGIREPRHGQDVALPGRPEPADREVVVLWRGNAVALQVSDAEGRPLGVTGLQQALDSLRELAPYPGTWFTTLGYLDSDTAAAVLGELRDDPDNEAAYQRLRDALFVVNLSDESLSAETHLERVAFGVHQAFPLKPTTYQVSLTDDRFLGLHLEHSMVDGATVGAVIGQAQLVEAVEGDGGPTAATTPLAWTVSAPRAESLADAMSAYEHEARHYRVEILALPVSEPPARLPFHLSQDACMQFVMQYAQLRAYGRLRSTYESVDMREYQGGRTECLRPNTAAAAALAAALLRGDATVDHLRLALEDHRLQVKRCKAGQAVDRHLFGLRFIARGHGYAAPLFEDPAYRILTTDFLSTTSLGDQGRIVRAAFAPTSQAGIGMHYVTVDDGYEFCLSYDERICAGVDDFAEALRAGTRALQELITSAATAQETPAP